MKHRKHKHHKALSIRLKDLVIAEVLGALISGVIGGIVHLAYDTFHIDDKVANICDILNQKDQASCKKAIESIMDASEHNIENYTVQVE